MPKKSQVRASIRWAGDHDNRCFKIASLQKKSGLRLCLQLITTFLNLGLSVRLEVVSKPQIRFKGKAQDAVGVMSNI